MAKSKAVKSTKAKKSKPAVPMAMDKVNAAVAKLPERERKMARRMLKHPPAAEGRSGAKTQVEADRLPTILEIHKAGLNFRALEVVAGQDPASGMNAYRAVQEAKALKRTANAKKARAAQNKPKTPHIEVPPVNQEVESQLTAANATPETVEEPVVEVKA